MSDLDIEEEIKKYLETIGKNYSKFLLCYNLFQLENRSRAPNIIGQEEAEKNVNMMHKYNSIFLVLDFGMIDLAILELHKIFEKQNPKYPNSKTISLITFIDFLRENKEKINMGLKENFESKCKELKEEQLHFLSMEEIKTEQGGKKLLNEEFFGKINKKIISIKDKIRQLKNSRDNRGHNLDILKEAKITYDDLDVIKEEFLEIFNIINLHLGNGIYDYSFYHKDTKRHFELLLRNLKEFNEIRSLFFNNFLENLGKTDDEILKEIKTILNIDF